MKRVKLGRGRPMKYGRASRAVTLTLPEDIIVRLGAIDADLGRAIVALTERHGKPRTRMPRHAEIAAYGNHAVIVVNPAKELKRLPGVQLVPVGNGRALIALEPPYSAPRLELDLRDLLERGGITGLERETLDAIADILRRSRQSRRISLEERMIIVLEAKRHRRRAGSRRENRK
jgi:hypothetical protein